MNLRAGLLIALLFLLPTLAVAGEGSQYVASYLQLWLKEHQVESSLKAGDVVAVADKGLGVSGEILQVQDKGKGSFLVETQLRIDLPDGRQIEENVVGLGATARDAFLDSMQSMCLTTLHPMYAEFIDAKDEHVARKTLRVAGVDRTVYFSGWGVRGKLEASEAEMEELLSRVLRSLENAKLDDKVHWGKLVVASIKGELNTLVLTLDNQPEEARSKNLESLPWPKAEEFYMIKLFFVIAGGKGEAI